MMMQNNSKEIEVKNNIIDLRETGTIGAKKKYDYPFHPDSYEYWFFEVPNEEKLRILLEKFNQTDKYFRSHSIEHLIETIFNSSKGQFFIKQRESEEYLELMPNRKEQFIDDEKLKVFNLNKELKVLLGGSESLDDCFLDLERSKEVLINYTFGGLGFKSVSEISNYINLLIVYRGNLLYMAYLKQRSTPPAPKEIEQGNKKVLSAREQNTIDKYRNYVTFYCRHRTELKQDVSRATVDTTKHFSINTKTLQRAINKCKDILDTNKISN